MSKKVNRLPMNIQLFAEGGEPSPEPTPAPTPTPAPAEPKAKEHMIPKSRFDEVNNKYKDIQSQLDAMKADQAEAERLALEKQGEFESLYKTAQNELDQLKSKSDNESTRVATLENIMNEMLDSKVEAIGEDYMDLIPANLTVEQKLAWINKAEEKGLFKGKEEIVEIGKPMNIDPPKVDDSNFSPREMLYQAYRTEK